MFFVFFLCLLPLGLLLLSHSYDVPNPPNSVYFKYSCHTGSLFFWLFLLVNFPLVFLQKYFLIFSLLSLQQFHVTFSIFWGLFHVLIVSLRHIHVSLLLSILLLSLFQFKLGWKSLFQFCKSALEFICLPSVLIVTSDKF